MKILKLIRKISTICTIFASREELGISNKIHNRFRKDLGFCDKIRTWRSNSTELLVLARSSSIPLSPMALFSLLYMVSRARMVTIGRRNIVARLAKDRRKVPPSELALSNRSRVGSPSPLESNDIVLFRLRVTTGWMGCTVRLNAFAVRLIRLPEALRLGLLLSVVSFSLFFSLLFWLTLLSSVAGAVLSGATFRCLASGDNPLVVVVL
mmetsp:Transcript_12429/g.21726  ORF Transcript_12429/g.21726 Transcript_12429/m.21726 type:complete len:209 (-) Transcript_12429:538-1164(-)